MQRTLDELYNGWHDDKLLLYIGFGKAEEFCEDAALQGYRVFAGSKERDVCSAIVLVRENKTIHSLGSIGMMGAGHSSDPVVDYWAYRNGEAAYIWDKSTYLEDARKFRNEHSAE